MNRSPSGSLCPYYYQGGELHPLKYGSYFTDKAALFAVIQAEEAFILKSPGQKNRRIWIDLYETTLDEDVVDVLTAHIRTISPKIFKLCFAGGSLFDRKRVKRKLAEKHIDIADQFRFFPDPEKAKQWLVAEASL